jgi:hypothetical protein
MSVSVQVKNDPLVGRVEKKKRLMRSGGSGGSFKILEKANFF